MIGPPCERAPCIIETGALETVASLTEHSVLAQTKDAYPYKIAMDYMTTFCNFRQPANLPDAEYHEKFNTMASILASVLNITLSHQPDLLNYVSQDLYGKDFDDLTTNVAAIEKVIEDNQEQFLASYNMIPLTNPSHSGLCDSLHNDYIQEGSKRYPKNRSAAPLVLLEQTTKTPTVSSVSEGSLFAQKGGNAAKKSKPNENKWANKECTHCGKKGHNPDKCFKKNGDKESKDSSKLSEPKDSKSKSSNDCDDVSVLSGISKQDLKTFTMVAQQLKEELSDSEDDVTPSHFQHNFVLTRERSVYRSGDHGLHVQAEHTNRSGPSQSDPP
jgi:hypothetical protein